jgi:peptidoglycan/xylan/chitin deacetylase (PgdA/CDA1 family)
LLQTLEPLVADAQALDCPWWSGRTPAPMTPDTPVNAWGWRQLLRRQLTAVLPRRRFLVRGPADSRSVCLTFDDGPHPEYTPRLLDLLRRYGVTATFFVVGRLVQRYPELVRRIAAEGHTVGNHSFLHAQLSHMSAGEAIRGVLKTQQLLAELLGKVPTLYRPPRGKLSALKVLGLWQHGLSIVLWNVDPRDYACESAEQICAWFRRRPLQGGDVVLLHDRLPLALGALPELIESVRERGLNFAPVSAWTT